MRNTHTIILSLGVATLCAACGSSTTASSGAASWWSGSDASSTGTNTPGGGNGGGGSAKDDGSGSTDTPEVEKDYEFGAPEGSPSYVYIPSAGTDNLVKIDGKSLAVTLVEVGDRPVTAKAVPGHDAVLVLNAGSDDVAYVRSTATGDAVDFLTMTPHANTLSVSPSGDTAIAYYDHTHAQAGDLAGSLQDITIFHLGDAPTSLNVAIGFHPTGVAWKADGSLAFVVTDDGICVLNPQTAQDGDIVPAIALQDDPLEKPTGREVQVTPDGLWAVLRQDGLQGLTAVHLPSKARVHVPLDAVPTDLDLLPDGRTALAMVRDAKQVALVALPLETTPTLAAETLSTGTLVAGLAHVTDDGKTALLFTSLNGVEQAATLDLATRTIAPVLLRKTVDFVLLVPGTRKAVLVHKPAAGPNHTDETEAFVDDSEGITLYDLDTGYTKLVLTPVKTAGIATLASPDLAWLLLRDVNGTNNGVLRANLKGFQTEVVPLGSPPEFARVLAAAGVVAVTQTHASGRVSFLPVGGGDVKTVTGYELNGKVH